MSRIGDAWRRVLSELRILRAVNHIGRAVELLGKENRLDAIAGLALALEHLKTTPADSLKEAGAFQAAPGEIWMFDTPSGGRIWQGGAGDEDESEAEFFKRCAQLSGRKP